MSGPFCTNRVPSEYATSRLARVGVRRKYTLAPPVLATMKVIVRGAATVAVGRPFGGVGVDFITVGDEELPPANPAPSTDRLLMNNPPMAHMATTAMTPLAT